MYQSGGRLLFKGGSLAKERAVGSGEEAALQLPGGGWYRRRKQPRQRPGGWSKPGAFKHQGVETVTQGAG